jgi:hypothetical protein
MYFAGVQLELDDDRFIPMEPQGRNIVVPACSLPVLDHPMGWEPKLVWVLSFRIFHPTLLVTGDRNWLVILRRIIMLMETVIVEAGMVAEITEVLPVCEGGETCVGVDS